MWLGAHHVSVHVSRLREEHLIQQLLHGRGDVVLGVEGYGPLAERPPLLHLLLLSCLGYVSSHVTLRLPWVPNMADFFPLPAATQPERER